jgi:hypothetical protein
MTMTIQRAAKTALECQDACNLSGVLAPFKEIVHEVVWPEACRLAVTPFLGVVDHRNLRDTLFFCQFRWPLRPA